MKIGVVNYGIGNIGSVTNMLNYIGRNVEIISNPDELNRVDKLILPGVGSFDKGMAELNNREFIEPLYNRVVHDSVPILGICLGMQMLMRSSEEGILPGLGLIDGDTRKFVFTDKLEKYRTPHMGWNIVYPRYYKSLFNNQSEEYRFYFVHSYHVVCNNDADILATAKYGYEFICAVEHENIFGVQFHPEKSHKFGMDLLRNFADFKC